MRWVTCKYGQFGHDNWSACFCWCFSFGKNCWCHFWCWHAIAIDLFGEIALFSQVIPQCAICTLGAKCSIRIANNKVLTILWVVIKTVFFRCAIASYFEYFQTSRWDFKQGLELIKKNKTTNKRKLIYTWGCSWILRSFCEMNRSIQWFLVHISRGHYERLGHLGKVLFAPEICWIVRWHQLSGCR